MEPGHGTSVVTLIAHEKVDRKDLHKEKSLTPMENKARLAHLIIFLLHKIVMLSTQSLNEQKAQTLLLQRHEKEPCS